MVLSRLSKEDSKMKEVNEILGRAKALWEEGNAINQSAISEGRPLTGEEVAKVKSLFEEVLNLKRQADELHKVRQMEESIRSWMDEPVYTHPYVSESAKSEEKALERYLRSKGVEVKDLSALSDPEGGYWLSSTIADKFVAALDNLLYIRQLATIVSIGAGRLEIPASSLSAQAFWTAEKKEITPSSIESPAAKLTFIPHTLAFLVRIPNSLREDASFDIVAHIINRGSRAVAEEEEKAFIAGDGSLKPLGIINSGIPAFSVKTAGSAEIVPEDIRMLPMKLKVQYRNSNTRWLLNRTYMEKILLMRDESGGSNTGQFLWQPSFQAGVPFTLCGYPVLETEYLPNPTAAGDPIAIFGDFSRYLIVERKGLTVQVLQEIYATSDEIAVLGKVRVDGGIEDVNTFVRLNANAGL